MRATQTEEEQNGACRDYDDFFNRTRYTVPEGVLEGAASPKANFYAATDLPPNECEGAFPIDAGCFRVNGSVLCLFVF